MKNNTGFSIIYTPHYRFKLSDWLKEGHMTWIIFDNVHVWKLIQAICVNFYYFPDSKKQLAVTAAEFGTW